MENHHQLNTRERQRRIQDHYTELTQTRDTAQYPISCIFIDVMANGEIISGAHGLDRRLLPILIEAARRQLIDLGSLHRVGDHAATGATIIPFMKPN